MTAFPTYSTGTVAVANGATSIIGTGSNWTGANAKPGDDIVVDGHTVVVLDVTDATTLAIDAWPYTTVSAGASYKIIKRSPLRFVGGEAMADVSTLVAALNTDGFYVFVASDLTEPDPSYGEENQFALQASTGKIWLKTGGVWVFQGIYKGFNITGAWSGATAYTVGDVVSLAGSSYVCILDHTNQTPPNVTYWDVLAAKGDTGATGSTGAAGADAPTYGGTSTTSLTIGTGSKVFTTQASLAYTNGARVRASSAANASNWMEGTVTYSGTTLTMTSDKTNGSGTLADWNFNIVGEPGAGDLSSANNLSDLANAQTARGNLAIMFPPQGRLTLATGVAVMTSTQSAKTTIYYTPYVGNQIPIYDGTKMVPSVFSELSVATTDTTKNPAAIGASKINDWFVWNDAGTLRLSHGPDWTSDTARSAGTALTMVNGILLNNASITNGPAASRGTYVGTTRSNASSQLDWIIGGSGSGGVAAFLWVWNAYNRVDQLGSSIDSASAYTYSSGSVRQANGSAGNQVSFVVGLQEETAIATYSHREQTAAVSTAALGVGIGYDTTSSYSAAQDVFRAQIASAISTGATAGIQIQPAIGVHFFSGNENSDGTNSSTFNHGTNNKISVSMRM